MSTSDSSPPEREPADERELDAARIAELGDALEATLLQLYAASRQILHALERDADDVASSPTRSELLAEVRRGATDGDDGGDLAALIDAASGHARALTATIAAAVNRLGALRSGDPPDPIADG